MNFVRESKDVVGVVRVLVCLIDTSSSREGEGAVRERAHVEIIKLHAFCSMRDVFKCGLWRIWEQD